MKKVSFHLSLDEANILFRALGKLPFEEVYELIGKMNDQANRQLTDGTSDADNVKSILRDLRDNQR
jgi:hypothetical protein